MSNTPEYQLTKNEYDEVIKFRTGTKRRKIVEHIISKKECSVSELLDLANISLCSLSTHLTKIKSRSNINCNVSNNIVYAVLKSKEKPKKINTAIVKSIPNNEMPSVNIQNDNINRLIPILPKYYIDKITKLSLSDQHDTLDMIKKALFYQKSAISLIEANEQINIIHNNL